MNKHQRRRQRLKERNAKVRKYYKDHLAKNPQWRHSAIVELIADAFYLAEGTVEAILSGWPPYDDETDE